MRAAISTSLSPPERRDRLRGWAGVTRTSTQAVIDEALGRLMALRDCRTAAPVQTPKSQEAQRQRALSQRQLHCAEVLRASIDQRRLGPTHRVRSVLRGVQAQLIDPVPEDSGVLASAQMW